MATRCQCVLTVMPDPSPPPLSKAVSSGERDQQPTQRKRSSPEAVQE